MPTKLEMSELVIVRHATTDWNLPGRLNSSTDIPLNKQGIHEAARLARYLHTSYPRATVWSSPAKRAQETASVISEGREESFRTIEAMKEADFGRFEGKTKLELSGTTEGSLYEIWENGGKVENVESLRRVGIRARSALEHIRNGSNSSQNILVSHGVFIRIFICVNALMIAPTAYCRFIVDNASVSLLRIDGGCIRVALLNDTNHLKKPEY